MPPNSKKKKAAKPPPLPFGMPMSLDPSQPVADEQGRYRSVAGPNPAPSMSIAPRPIPQVSTTADTVARRMAARAQMPNPEQELSSMQSKKRAKKSLMELFLEMNS